MSSTIIIGGGALGSALFRECSRRGSETTLVDRAGGASWHSFSWINAAAPTTSLYHTIRVQSVIRHLLYSVPRGVAHFGGVLAWDGEDGPQPIQGSNLIESVAEAVARLGNWGHQAELLSATQARDIEPGLNVESIGDNPILWTPDEGWVDLPALVSILRKEGRRAGGHIVEGQEAHLTFNKNNDRVTGVTLANGETLSADTVVVAAGAHTPHVLEQAGFDLPMEPSLGLIVRTQPLKTEAPNAILRGPEVSIRPEPDNRVVLHSGETDPSAADLENPEALETAAELLCRRAETVLHGAKLSVQSIDYGVRPLSADHFPVVGAVPTVEGLYSFQTHAGATVCLMLAELAARELVQGVRSELLQPFGPERFQVR